MSDQNTILLDILTDETKIFILSAGQYQSEFKTILSPKWVQTTKYKKSWQVGSQNNHRGCLSTKYYTIQEMTEIKNYTENWTIAKRA